MSEFMVREFAEITRKVRRAERLRELDKSDEAMNILKAIRQDHKTAYEIDIYTRRLIEEEITSISTEKALELYEEGKHREACSLFLDTLESSKGHLRELDHLKYKNVVALHLLESGEHARSYAMFKEVASRQAELLSSTDRDLLCTLSYLARALDRLGRCKESLVLYEDVLIKMKKKMGNDDLPTITIQVNMAVVLLGAGATERALELSMDAFERRRRILGSDNPDTFTAQTNVANALIALNRFTEAFNMLTEVFNGRREKLGSSHQDTLRSQGMIGLVLIKQSKNREALKLLNEVHAKQKSILGDTHPETRAFLSHIEALKSRLGQKKFAELQSSCEQNDDFIKLIDLIKAGDSTGVEVMLEKGIDITRVTAGTGNTPLHIAVYKNNISIIEILLMHAFLKLTSSDFRKFINARRTSTAGSTAMHIAASKGFLDAMKALLKHGAIYNIKNKNGETPCEVADDPFTKSFLAFIDEMFEVARREGMKFSHRLEGLNMNVLWAISGAKDDRGRTLGQAAMDCYKARFAWL